MIRKFNDFIVNEEMNNDSIKKLFSEYILSSLIIKDKGAENTLREILFNSNIDWNKALKIAKKNMPEINSLF